MNFRLLGILMIVFYIAHSCQDSATDHSSVSSHIPEAFATHCATCHGDDLKGDIAQSLLDGSWQFGSRKNDIARSIKFGHPHHGMPSWSAILNDEEIDSLASFLLAEEERLGIAKPTLPPTIETQDYVLTTTVVADGLDRPWAIAFTGNDDAYITQKGGSIRIIQDGALSGDTVTGLPAVKDQGQGGLLDINIDPDYASNGWVYLSCSQPLEPKEGEDAIPAMTKVVRGHIENNSWTDEQVLFEANHDHYRNTSHHYGSRIVFDPDGFLYFSIGDRGAQDMAQDLSRPNGKVHRINKDGTIPSSNPFYGQPNLVQSIYSYGHRNPQGLAVHPATGRVWDTEHGPLGGDELNLISAGKNYGWPVISYGINYNGTILTELTAKEGMEQPNFYWKPSIAVCGLDFYSGDLFPKWQNKLLVGALKFEEVQLLDIVDDRVIYRQPILKNYGRVRDVTTGPDGAIYVVLNNPDQVIRLGKQDSI